MCVPLLTAWREYTFKSRHHVSEFIVLQHSIWTFTDRVTQSLQDVLLWFWLLMGPQCFYSTLTNIIGGLIQENMGQKPRVLHWGPHYHHVVTILCYLKLSHTERVTSCRVVVIPIALQLIPHSRCLCGSRGPSLGQGHQTDMLKA